LLFNFRNKYGEKLSLGAKERVLEHDLELIEEKNIKILCKNVRHGRA